MDLRTLIATNNVINASDLSYNEVLVLGYIAEHPNEIVGDVSSAVGLLPAGLSRTVNMLELRGMVERSIDRKDRRKLRLNTTKFGDELYQKLQQELRTI